MISHFLLSFGIKKKKTIQLFEKENVIPFLQTNPNTSWSSESYIPIHADPFQSIQIHSNPQDGIEEAAEDSAILAKDLADILDRNPIQSNPSQPIFNPSCSIFIFSEPAQ